MIQKQKPVASGTAHKAALLASKFEVKWVPIGSLKLWDGNPRQNDDAAKDLAEVIRVHGIKSPLVVWDKNNVIYKGNTTFKALKILGFKEVPVVFHSFASEVAAQAYGIADNKASELAGWDNQLLVKMMNTKEFKASGLFASTGFSSKEIELLDFWPPDANRVSKAKKEGKEIYFSISVKVQMDDFSALKREIEALAAKYKNVSVR